MPRLTHPYFGIRCWREIKSYLLLLALLLAVYKAVDGRNHGFRHVDVKRYMMIWILRMSSRIDLLLTLQHVLLIERDYDIGERMRNAVGSRCFSSQASGPVRLLVVGCCWLVGRWSSSVALSSLSIFVTQDLMAVPSHSPSRLTVHSIIKYQQPWQKTPSGDT